jgi:hypothetical protein
VLYHNVHFDNVLFLALILTRCFDNPILTQCHIDDALLVAPILMRSILMWCSEDTHFDNVLLATHIMMRHNIDNVLLAAS